MTRASVYSIDAGLPFARDLAAGVIKLAASPERLAGGLILLPSRRASSALQAAFLDVVDGAPTLLPRTLRRWATRLIRSTLASRSDGGNS